MATAGLDGAVVCQRVLMLLTHAMDAGVAEIPIACTARKVVYSGHVHNSAGLLLVVGAEIQGVKGRAWHVTSKWVWLLLTRTVTLQDSISCM